MPQRSLGWLRLLLKLPSRATRFQWWQSSLHRVPTVKSSWNRCKSIHKLTLWNCSLPVDVYLLSDSTILFHRQQRIFVHFAHYRGLSDWWSVWKTPNWLSKCKDQNPNGIHCNSMEFNSLSSKSMNQLSWRSKHRQYGRSSWWLIFRYQNRWSAIPVGAIAMLRFIVFVADFLGRCINCNMQLLQVVGTAISRFLQRWIAVLLCYDWKAMWRHFSDI